MVLLHVGISAIVGGRARGRIYPIYQSAIKNIEINLPCKFAALLLLPSGKNICLVICLEPKGYVTAYCLEIITGER